MLSPGQVEVCYERAQDDQGGEGQNNEQAKLCTQWFAQKVCHKAVISCTRAMQFDVELFVFEGMLQECDEIGIAASGWHADGERECVIEEQFRVVAVKLVNGVLQVCFSEIQFHRLQNTLRMNVEKVRSLSVQATRSYSL